MNTIYISYVGGEYVAHCRVAVNSPALRQIARTWDRNAIVKLATKSLGRTEASVVWLKK